eukprot:m.490574 g.490574  ORF g.490574 m.490574 type:complete len:59 (+) comp28297_c0_seq1:35-211(+)
MRQLLASELCGLSTHSHKTPDYCLSVAVVCFWLVVSWGARCCLFRPGLQFYGARGVAL